MWVIEDPAVIYVEECFAYVLSSRSFIVSGLTFRSLIHVEFIVVYGVKKCYFCFQWSDSPMSHQVMEVWCKVQTKSLTTRLPCNPPTTAV